ncbi:hypothetical protein CDAR_475701 [Caerostris darwini]|uniref:Uncharacterized protein n=1 Tax=Caerostris darwini TaxID=1538125 RepID=A0AAV4P8M7_9ARAC|nr:hypothetical protein CDAR_475701 [Caerostris darwini]
MFNTSKDTTTRALSKPPQQKTSLKLFLHPHHPNHPRILEDQLFYHSSRTISSALEREKCKVDWRFRPVKMTLMHRLLENPPGLLDIGGSTDGVRIVPSHGMPSLK